MANEKDAYNDKNLEKLKFILNDVDTYIVSPRDAGLGNSEKSLEIYYEKYNDTWYSCAWLYMMTDHVSKLTVYDKFKGSKKIDGYFIFDYGLHFNWKIKKNRWAAEKLEFDYDIILNLKTEEKFNALKNLLAEYKN